MAVESLSVLRKDKELLVFPLLSLMACVLVIASFACLSGSGIRPTGSCNSPSGRRSGSSGPHYFAFYAANYFIILFFNAALVAGALIRLRGGDPTC